MTDSNSSTMEVLTGASNIKISNANFSSVGRNQYNYYTQTTIVQTRDKKRKIGSGLSELSEFTEIKRGDIYKTKDGICYSWRLCSNGKDDTEAAVYYAEVNIAGTFGEKKFTVKTYRGQNAMKEWRRDFSRCSKDWLRDVPFFGYNKSSVPSLIFSGELVPVANIEGGLGQVGLYYTELLRKAFKCSRNELWVDPRQGRFCRGPIGPKCRDWRAEADIDGIIPSDVEFLKEDVIIRYFASKEDDGVLLHTLSYTGHIERLHDIPATSHIQVISSLTKSTIAFLEDVWWWGGPDCFDNGQVTPNGHGATRFCLRDNRRKIQVDTVNESISWLLQASSVFHALNISLDEDLSTYKLVFPHLNLTGTLQKSKRKRHRRQLLRTPIYFIIRSSSNPVYHWSIDPTGQTPLSREICKFLGLPFKLSLRVTQFQESWPTKFYKHIHDYQIVRKFDPKSIDFAQSRGSPIFDLIPAENCFQEIVEGQHEIPAESDDVPFLPVVNLKDDSESVLDSNAYADHVEDQSPEESDDTFALHLLFDGTEAYTNASHSPDDVDLARSSSANPAYTCTQQGTMRSFLDALFAPFTWEAIEGSEIAAAAI